MQQHETTIHDLQGKIIGVFPKVEDEGIDYSDIPDVGSDDAFWTGGRVGPVLPVKAAERPS